VPTIERQDSVLNILRNLRDLGGLKRLFWQELNYERENRPLSPRQWPESARQPLAEDPILFASGGEDNAFHVVYCRLESDALLRGHERPIVNRLTREHPYALFVFSNKSRTDWHFLNVKYDEEADKRRLLRRITVRPGAGLRTAAERLCMVDLVDGVDRGGGQLSPLAIQSAHDDAFDVEKVSKDFYREIANWYFWALKHTTFPKDAPKEQDGRDHISVIRLITRLIFCWFIREKGLIPDVLFDEAKLAEMLDGFAPRKTRNKDSVFYRAILQNLFFATLNTEMDQRAWRRADQNFMAHSLYRHKECFRDPKAGLEWFKDIPFLNGGLFECLDRDKGEGVKDRYVRVDGFSDRADSRPTVPDFLFFGSEQDVDLSDDYGDKKFRSVRVRGLIDTLSRYKFTIEENTPFDQEVALDPELCGKVFENLLAAYNPETGTTARKATGSFYTPREIVDYMVDESLVAYLKEKIEPRMDANERESGGPTSVSAAGKTDATERVPPGIEPRIRALLAYDTEMPRFSEKETEALIDAIDNLKALDPAVGSGAFPMGILHKLVLVLGKLDPDNERWKAKQIAKLDDATMREDAERLFRENYDDYGRKLYLIENCIYGVDIQPIAVQIAKMRFFISLIVDQKVNPKAPNLGVRALPNLETKFVATNTLIGIDRPAQMMLRNPDIDKKEDELRQVRQKHFTARTPKSKAKCREDDKRLRAEIAELLKNDGWDNTTAKQLAAWDPYDQNGHATFFDSEWMFGVMEGFDVVIGNPPYLNVELVDAKTKAYYAQHYRTFYKRYDVFGLFYEAGLTRLGGTGAIITLIVPQQVANNLSYKKLRDMILANRYLREVLYLGDKIFEAANNDVCVLFLNKRGESTIRLVHALDFERRTVTEVPADHFERYGNVISFSGDAGGEAIFAKVFSTDRWHVKDRFSVFQGIVTGNNAAFLPTAEQIGKAKIEKALLHPILLGRDFEKWAIRSTERRIVYVNKDTDLTRYPNARKWLVPFRPELEKRRECVNGVIPWYSLQWPRVRAELDRVPKILVQGTRNPRLATRVVATMDEQCVYGTQGLNFIVPRDADAPIYFLLAVLNSTLINHLYATKFLNVAIKAEYLKDTPIPRTDARDTKSLDALARRILAAKAADPAADTSAWEREIDERVYKLYGLTAEEVAIVEGATQGKGGGK
jgi:adenine-specific DNA-methyltransferase